MEIARCHLEHETAPDEVNNHGGAVTRQGWRLRDASSAHTPTLRFESRPVHFERPNCALMLANADDFGSGGSRRRILLIALAA
jgi:hypothetical protein